MKPIPFMILSDAPDTHSGLGRIARDLANGISKMPEFRVSTFGRGGRCSAKLPWPQYVFGPQDGWGEPLLEECWRDFAGREPGVLFTIFDPSRLRWLVSKDNLPDGLVSFLDSAPFQRWAYMPVDSTGPNNRLTGIVADTIGRFDRVLAYSLWGKQVIERSIGRDVEWSPHGINLDVFQPRDKAAARAELKFGEQDTVVGMVATNQVRKDWGLAFCAVAELRKKRPNLKFWCHIDTMNRHWNLHALIGDYGLQDAVQITTTRQFNDRDLSRLYSACDLTILPSTEGFGYPLAESLACGVPVVHSSYGGGTELIPHPGWLVEPVAYQLDTPYNALRPVFDPGEWIAAMERALDSGWSREQCRSSVAHLDLKLLWPSTFKKWLLDGIVVTP